MGTTALIFIQEGSVGILFINMKCFVLSGLLSLSLAAPAPEAEAALGYPLFGHHVAPLAVVPVKQLQWPGVSAPGVDSTCFGCRASVVVPVGRRRREAEAVAEAVAEAEAEPKAEAEAAVTPFHHLPLAPFHPPYHPYHVPLVGLRSSSYAHVNNGGVAYNPGVHAVHVVPVGRRRRDAGAEADAEIDAEADAEAEAVVIAPLKSLNGYAHNLGSGNSYASISSGPAVPQVYGFAAHPAVYGYPYLG